MKVAPPGGDTPGRSLTPIPEQTGIGAMANSKTPLFKTETRHHPLGKTCHHFEYHHLTCDEYDDLRARAGGHCQICGIAEEDTRRGFLVVDHFRGRKTRVIRGLLCDLCNTTVMRCIDGSRVWGDDARKLEARAREYERASWQVPSEEARQEMAARVEMSERAPGTIKMKMDMDLWERLDEAVKRADPDSNRSALLRRFARWYVGDIEEMPRRPEPRRPDR
jgi:hypothetical protein